MFRSTSTCGRVCAQVFLSLALSLLVLLMSPTAPVSRAQAESPTIDDHFPR
jgi:hypothetical protein